MEFLKYGLITVGSLIIGYITFRVVAMAIFKSWFEVKKSEERRNDHDNHRLGKRHDTDVK
jgi:hypothetical protein